MKKRIGAKIKDLRQEKLMTQSELAGDRITRSMLSLIEHGNSEPSLSSLAYLADRLHVSPSYLLATEEEDEMYRRATRIRDVRLAYGAGEYGICLDLCRSIGISDDDELNLLSAESAIGLALEEIREGRLHGVADRLDTAISFAERTRYGTAHVYAEAAVLARYLTRFSETFYSDAEEVAAEKGIPTVAATGEPFCAYALMLSEIEDGEPSQTRERLGERLAALRISAPVYAAHIEELLTMREGRIADALPQIERILSENDSLPRPILYELFRDREIAAREVGDYKGAYESASAKHEFLSQLLSEV